MALTVRVVFCLPDTLHELGWPLYITRISTSLSLAAASRGLLLVARSIFISCKAFTVTCLDPFSSCFSESKPYGSQFY